MLDSDGLCECGGELSEESRVYDGEIVVIYWKCDNCTRRYREVFTHASIEEIVE